MELNDIFSAIGYNPEGEPTVEGLNEYLNKNFVSRKVLKDDEEVISLINSGYGKRGGEIETVLKRTYKELFEESPELPEKAKAEDVIEAFKSKQRQLVEQYEGKLKDNGAEKWQQQIDGYKTKLTERDNMIEALRGEVNETKQGFEKFKSDIENKQTWDHVTRAVKFSDSASELEREGFWNKAKEAFEFQKPSEEDKGLNFVVIDKKTGKRPMLSNNTDYMAPEDALQSLANKLGVGKLADSGKPNKPNPAKPKPEQGDRPQLPGAAKALNNLARMANQ